MTLSSSVYKHHVTVFSEFAYSVHNNRLIHVDVIVMYCVFNFSPFLFLILLCYYYIGM